RWVPSDLTKSIRKEFLDTNHCVGLVGVVPGESHRTTDIDRVISGTNLEPGDVREAVLKTSQGMRLKMPPQRQTLLDRENAVRVQVVQSEEQLLECFRLRHQIYGLMAYLDEEVASTPSNIEIDSYDTKSLHFIATEHRTGETAGTLRLVLPGKPRIFRNSVVGDVDEVLDHQAEWCTSIARKVPEPVFREKIETAGFFSLPIFQSFDFRARWQNVLMPPMAYGEISRVVVSPQYRGLGVSKLLVRAAIAAAFDIDKHFLLLECVPAHAEMYAKYGFERLEGHHSRAQDLDQIAVGMRLIFKDVPPKAAVDMAKRDISMIRDGPADSLMLFGSKHLCLCGRTPCWTNGEYQYRNHVTCPLRALHGCV
ncbi:MAG: GNAT family N-acetyltransferase, partial [Woeseia sp.]